MSNSSSSVLNSTGIQIPKDACIVMVRTEWNASTIDLLQEGCIRVLEAHPVSYKIVTVPGAFEIPFAIRKYHTLHPEHVSAFIALGCVLRGDTPHFDYVCKAVTDGILQLNLILPVPTIFGILTVDNQQQIDERTGGKHGHKGEEAAISALKMIAENLTG